jgi:hypothetical protein
MDADRQVLSLEPIADDPEVGRWLAAMEDARRDTLRELDGVPEDLIDQRPPADDNSIGALLYHVAFDRGRLAPRRHLRTRRSMARGAAAARRSR